MDAALMGLITQAVAGAAAANGAGSVAKEQSLGTVQNTIAGLIGGGLLGQILPMILNSGAIEGVIGNIVGGGLGGAAAMMAVSYLKKMVNKA
jgi:hypothetical protein